MTGDDHPVKLEQSAKNAWLALVILSRTEQAAFHFAESFVSVFWSLYVIGLALLTRQYAQERANWFAKELGLTKTDAVENCYVSVVSIRSLPPSFYAPSILQSKVNVITDINHFPSHVLRFPCLPLSLHDVGLTIDSKRNDRDSTSTISLHAFFFLSECDLSTVNVTTHIRHRRFHNMLSSFSFPHCSVCLSRVSNLVS